jgi:hypothetical protein
MPTRKSAAATTGPPHRKLSAVASVWIVVGLIACGGGARSEAPTTIGPTPGTVDAAPKPAFAWALDGDAEPSIGGVQLELSGSHRFGSDAVAFDGVTGSAASAEPGPIDTTNSFSVAAWVSLNHSIEYAVAVSQVGEVAAAFYLGYTKFEWSFNMKSADGPGGNEYARVGRHPDPAAWVHLVGVYDDSAGQIRLYLDGERVAETSFSAQWQAAGPLTVGRSLADGAPANFWPGAIADVRVYPAALADDQIRAVRDESRPSSAPPPLAEVPEGFHCPSGGGRCLGPLTPGTYTTEIFSPSITYTVGEGWTNGEDLLGNFLLQIEGERRFLGIYRNVTVPLACLEQPDPDVGLTVGALADWYTSHPGLVTTDPEPISVGGLTGVVIDVSLDPSWTKGCGWSRGDPSVGIIIGAGPSSLTHVLESSVPEERLYLLEAEDGNVVIEVGPEGTSLTAFLELVAPIIESIEFGS